MLSDLATRLADLVAREKHVITRAWTKETYLTRWVLSGQRLDSRGSNIYLHRFQRSDLDEMHDHPWPFTTLILWGGYYEKTPSPGWNNGDGPTQTQWYGPGRILRRPANWIHSVVIPEGRECWSLLKIGVKEKSWGFFCPRVGYRPWREHLASAEATGHGCGSPDN